MSHIFDSKDIKASINYYVHNNEALKNLSYEDLKLLRDSIIDYKPLLGKRLSAFNISGLGVLVNVILKVKKAIFHLQNRSFSAHLSRYIPDSIRGMEKLQQKTILPVALRQQIEEAMHALFTGHLEQAYTIKRNIDGALQKWIENTRARFQLLNPSPQQRITFDQIMQQQQYEKLEGFFRRMVQDLPGARDWSFLSETPWYKKIKDDLTRQGPLLDLSQSRWWESPQTSPEAILMPLLLDTTINPLLITARIQDYKNLLAFGKEIYAYVVLNKTPHIASTKVLPASYQDHVEKMVTHLREGQLSAAYVHMQAASEIEHAWIETLQLRFEILQPSREVKEEFEAIIRSRQWERLTLLLDGIGDSLALKAAPHWETLRGDIFYRELIGRLEIQQAIQAIDFNKATWSETLSGTTQAAGADQVVPLILTAFGARDSRDWAHTLTPLFLNNSEDKILIGFILTRNFALLQGVEIVARSIAKEEIAKEITP